MERIPTPVLFLTFMFFFSFGEAIAEPIYQGVDIDSVRFLIKSLGGAVGVKALGASGTLVQILIRVLQSPLADGFFEKRKPWVRLAIISVLTFAITPLGLMVAGGIPLAAALVHTTTLNAFMVFLDQLLKHAPKKKDKKDEPRTASVPGSVPKNDAA